MSWQPMIAYSSSTSAETLRIFPYLLWHVDFMHSIVIVPVHWVLKSYLTLFV